MAKGGLRRDIGLTGSAFLAFNGIVGAGIFALPGPLHASFGGFAPWLFPIFGLLVLLIALPFARLAATHERTGGPAEYVAPFGPMAAFQTGWLYFVARITALAANANVFATYAGTLWAPLGTSLGRGATILALVALLTWVNIVGVKRAVRALDLLTLLKALPLVGLALWGLGHAAQGLPAPGPVPPLSALEASALVLLYAFVGFENASVPAEETADPKRTIPRAILFTVVATAALYMLVQLGYAAVMPAGAAPTAPLAAYAEALLGPAGAILLAVTAMASVAGNVGGSMTSTPRVTYALSQQGALPGWFGRIAGGYATPANSILFMGALGAVLAITGSFVWLAIVSTLSRLFVYAACMAALPRARPGGLSWLLMAAGLAVCIWAAAQSKWESWAMLAGFVLGGFFLYGLARIQRGPRREQN
ncbi:MAG TPA: APC family permease [Allosphingosinicella sp.]|nr:APC family permease [Allosphingosinicella sp.]